MTTQGEGLEHTYWSATSGPLPELNPVPDNHDTEVLVIGAGVTGLSTAVHLAQSGRDVAVLDAREPGWGASGRNHGQIVAALKHEPHEIERDFGVERGRLLIEAIGSAPDLVFDLIDRHKISCGQSRNGILTTAHSARQLGDLERRAEAWNRRGVPLGMLSKAEAELRTGSEYYHGACFDPRGGSVNPLAYIRGLAGAACAGGARISGDRGVESLEFIAGKWVARTATGKVSASRVVIATNGHTGDIWPRVKRTFLPVRTPQLVTEPVSPDVAQRILPGRETMSDTRALTLGVRVHPDNRLHFGGATATGGTNLEGAFGELSESVRQVFPFLGKLKFGYRWSGVMAMTPDRYPRLFDLAPGLVACLGYSGRGMGTGTMLGREIASWAAGDRRIDELALPVSQVSPLPYYDLRRLAVGIAVHYYRAKDRILR